MTEHAEWHNQVRQQIIAQLEASNEGSTAQQLAKLTSAKLADRVVPFMTVDNPMGTFGPADNPSIVEQLLLALSHTAPNKNQQK